MIVKLKRWNDFSNFNEISLVLLSKKVLYIATPGSGAQYPSKETKSAFKYFGTNLEELIKFSTDVDCISGKTKIFKENEKENSIYLNPEMVLEYDDEKRSVRLRTIFAGDSWFRFMNEESYRIFMEKVNRKEE